MPHRLRVCTIACAAVLIVACRGEMKQAANTPADAAPIDELRARYQTAYNSGDATALAALYADDAVSLPDHHSALPGKAAIEQYWDGIFRQYTASIELAPRDTEINGDIAHEHGEYSITVTSKAGGTPQKDGGKYAMVLKRGADGAWKVHHDIDNSNSMPTAPSRAEPHR